MEDIDNSNSNIHQLSSSSNSSSSHQHENSHSTNKILKRKIVSFSTLPTEKTISDVNDCLRYMCEGSEFLKVRSYARQYRRIYVLNESLTAISWFPTSKKASKAQVLIDSIKEIRLGKTTERLRIQAHQHPNETLFSIIYSDETSDCIALDLVANSVDEANIWVTGLSCLIAARAAGSLTTSDLHERQWMRDRWLRDAFAAELSSSNQRMKSKSSDDENRTEIKKNFIGEEEAIRLLFDYGISEDKSRVSLQEFQSKKLENRRGFFTTDELVQIFKKLSTRPEIYHLLVRYSQNQDFLSVEDLMLFLEAEQGMSKVNREKCLKIIEKFEPSNEAKLFDHMGIEGFTNYLLSAECEIFNPEHRFIYQDMDHPLNHYFIASSHNTFLLADQLKGASSVDGFVHALMRGCRSLDLQCFDGPEGQPTIHNGTLTSKISLIDALETINRYAFETSPYPLILCIDIQCSLQQQQRLARLLLDVFGEKLFLDQRFLDEHSQWLPSPEELRGKILIKSKKLPLHLIRTPSRSDYEEITDDDDCYEDHKRRSRKEVHQKKHRKLSRAFSDLVCLLRSSPFEDFHNSFSDQQFNQICTFSESAALRFVTSAANDLISYNKNFLSRITPDTWRVDSSNMNPQDFWNTGCQMVAMNYQTAGKFMDIYLGRFLSNGGCGYVLKPNYLRLEKPALMNSSVTSAKISSLVYSTTTPQILHIKIISALHLPRPEQAELKANSIDPYVVVQIFGVPRDCDEVRTRTVFHNPENPQFNESFEFEIAFPELALIRFVVLDDESLDYDFIGQCTLPFESIQSGYRHVHLYTIAGELITNAHIFVHIVINRKSLTTKPHRSFSRRKLRLAQFRSLNVKELDEVFKSVLPSLEIALEHRHLLERSLYDLTENCGLSTLSNVKQCIRKIATRLRKGNSIGELSIRNEDDIPIFEYSTNLPTLSRQSIVALEQLVERCRILIDNGDFLYQTLFDAQNEVCELTKETEKYFEDHGLRGKKRAKAVEDFSYNLALLHSHTELIDRAKQDAQLILQQILQAAETTGLLKTDP